jgi:hypothetical protein
VEVVRVEVGAGHTETVRCRQQREDGEICGHRRPRRHFLGDRRYGLAGRGHQRVDGVELVEPRFEPTARRLTVGLTLVGEQRRDGRYPVFEGDVDEDLTGKLLFVAPGLSIIVGQDCRGVGEQIGRVERTLSADRRQPGCAREEVVLVGVVHFDGIVEPKLADTFLAAVRRERRVDHE